MNSVNNEDVYKGEITCYTYIAIFCLKVHDMLFFKFTCKGHHLLTMSPLSLAPQSQHYDCLSVEVKGEGMGRERRRKRMIYNLSQPTLLYGKSLSITSRFRQQIVSVLVLFYSLVQLHHSVCALCTEVSYLTRYWEVLVSLKLFQSCDYCFRCHVMHIS